MDKKSSDETTPIVVDLGKKTKKSIKKLKKGSGKMVVEIQEAMDAVRARLPEADKHKVVVPVVMFVERKLSKKSGAKFPFSPFSMLK